jgi:glycosyltransferase involved in cell wall biosynthesis
MMKPMNDRSVRCLFDLQCCQSQGSRNRGVGRYSEELFAAVAAAPGQHDVWSALLASRPKPERILRAAKGKVLEIANYPATSSPPDYLGGDADAIRDVLCGHRLASLRADVVHVSHVFEGLQGDVALPSLQTKSPGQVYSATVYDLIPLRFPGHYFANSTFKRWYQHRLGWLRSADLLLAISDSTRTDLIDLLGLSPDRVLTIHGGYNAKFRAAEERGVVDHALRRRFGLRQNFLLYAAGDEFRKNIEGAIRGFAHLAPETRAQTTLAIVCAMSEASRDHCREVADLCGLTGADVVFTGYVSDEDLVALYQQCTCAVYPSLYEGLGLPIIEAMACGAPVIGSNTSSIAEVIQTPDALFDPSSTESIGEAIHRVLQSPGLRQDLSERGLARCQKFRWQGAAARALEAMDAAVELKRNRRLHAAVAGTAARKRLAILTPLPPLRSGIADYAAAFLPYLHKHFEVDLYVKQDEIDWDEGKALFRIYDEKDFPPVAERYDGIVYEVGNSEFHAHMLEAMEKFPGVVVLHDAYLSGLYGYLDFHLQQQGHYVRGMLQSHGAQVQKFLAPAAGDANGVFNSMVALPCTKAVLGGAIGVISHSPFNLEVARSFYPEGWMAPYHVVPQAFFPVRRFARSEVESFRAAHGVGENDILVVSAGHVAWTKAGDRLVEAVDRLDAGGVRHVHLLFVGEISKDAFGAALVERIEASRASSRVGITGYVEPETYHLALQAADIAVQLRLCSRGGTPRGVLDGMNASVSVIVNRDASYKDYPDGVVRYVSADPDETEIADAIRDLADSPELRASQSRRASEYLQRQHNPEACASLFAASVHEFLDRQKSTLVSRAARQLEPLVASSADPNTALADGLAWMKAHEPPTARKARLYIDCSYLTTSDSETGIARVVKNIIRQAYLQCPSDVEPVAVCLTGSQLCRATGVETALGLLPSDGTDCDLQPGDVLLMLDSSWAQIDSFAAVFEAARIAGVPILTVVYDLLPLSLPPACIVPGGAEWFRSWFIKAAKVSSGLITISASMAEEIRSCLQECPEIPRPPVVEHWHLGADFGKPADAPQATVTPPALDFLLMVGTIEPRKCHAMALAAMELLWEDGLDSLGLFIAGKQGWLVDDLMAKLRGHGRLGRQLFLQEAPADADIAALYKSARGLLFLSRGEGFGLPLVEAAHFETPILCSRLPVFQEIAGEHACYVNDDSPARLAEDIKTWHGQMTAGRVIPSKGMRRLTWAESYRQLHHVIRRMTGAGETQTSTEPT